MLSLGLSLNIDQLNGETKPFFNPSSSFNLETTKSLTSSDGAYSIGFSRGSGATYTDSTGCLCWAPENIGLRSQEFSNVIWQKTNSTVTDNVIANPTTGIFDICSQLETTTLGTHQNGSVSSISIPVGEFVTVTCIVKAIGDRYAYIGSNAGAFGSQEYVYYNLSNGTIKEAGTNIYSPSITALADGFYRIKWTSRAIATATPTFFILSARTTDTGRAPTFTGDVTKGIYVGEFQIQRGASATPYVRTIASAYYGPVFDHDPITLASKGLRIEESRTNRLTHSEDYNNAAWTKSDVTVVVDTTDTTSPEGLNNAQKLTEGVSGSASILATSSAITAGATIIASVMVKRGNHDWFRVAVTDPTATDSFRGWFNIATGATGSAGALGLGTIITHGIVNMGNGWYRCWVAGAINSTHTTCRLYTFSASADNTQTRVNNAVRYQFGSQLESITSSASTALYSSYIPTVGAIATRSADIATISSIGFYEQSEGTFNVEFEQNYINTSVSARSIVLSADDNTTANRHFVFANKASGLAGGGTTTLGSGDVDISSGLMTVNINTKTAYNYKLNDFSFVVNGSVAGNDFSGAIPTITQIRIGHRGSDYLNGWIRSFRYYNRRLTNNRAQDITL